MEREGLVSMTVGQLCEALSGMDSDTLVVLSKDGEGNEFSPLSEVGKGRYRADTTWSGELIEGEDDGAVKAVVLWPTN